jgi:hypothetical protein
MILWVFFGRQFARGVACLQVWDNDLAQVIATRLLSTACQSPSVLVIAMRALAESN